MRKQTSPVSSGFLNEKWWSRASSSETSFWANFQSLTNSSAGKNCHAREQGPCREANVRPREESKSRRQEIPWHAWTESFSIRTFFTFSCPEMRDLSFQ